MHSLVQMSLPETFTSSVHFSIELNTSLHKMLYSVSTLNSNTVIFRAALLKWFELIVMAPKPPPWPLKKELNGEQLTRAHECLDNSHQIYFYT